MRDGPVHIGVQRSEWIIPGLRPASLALIPALEHLVTASRVMVNRDIQPLSHQRGIRSLIVGIKPSQTIV
jgi:hypothetical protein